MKPTRILIADDHALLRHGLARVIERQKDLTIVGEAKDGAEAVSLSRSLNPDIVILDLSMPVMGGAEATRRIHESVPRAKILILTAFGTSADIAHAVRAGASGAIVKDADDEELIAAIRAVIGGRQAFSREIKIMLEKDPAPPELTDRQRKILKSIVDGLSTDAIADKFGLSPYTVNQHLDAIRKKLGAANRTEAVAIALRKHLLKI